MKTKNIAIVGLGHWGPNFARIVHEYEGANLVWCCDLSIEKLKIIQRFYPYVKTTTNLSDLLKDQSTDGIIVAVPAANHFDIAKRILQSGKDVLVEKPLTSSARDAIYLAEIANKNGSILMVDHTFIFNPAIQKIKELIMKNTLGKIHYGYGDYTALGPIRNDVSALWDLSTHFIYTVTHLLNKQPTGITAAGRAFLTPKIDDVAFLTLEFADNTLFNLRVSWADPIKTRTFVLVGDKKMVSFDDTQSDGKVKLFDRGIEKNNHDDGLLKHFFTLRYGDITIPHIPNKEPLKSVFEEFLIKTTSRKMPIITLQDAVNLVILLEAAQKSLKKNSQKIKLKYNQKTGFLSFRN
ncbi:Gfo/Idh/MocA family oxidoreductase [Candidatus Microgenomates bacterium]|nr:Gfo/Idh/MocA family oxidoreductase [Candidatus Microgenomates bacterium]